MSTSLLLSTVRVIPSTSTYFDQSKCTDQSDEITFPWISLETLKCKKLTCNTEYYVWRYLSIRVSFILRRYPTWRLSDIVKGQSKIPLYSTFDAMLGEKTYISIQTTMSLLKLKYKNQTLICRVFYKKHSDGIGGGMEYTRSCVYMHIVHSAMLIFAMCSDQFNQI